MQISENKNNSTKNAFFKNRGYHLLRKLRLTAQKQVNKNRRCLEMCLRQFEQDIEAMHQEEQEEVRLSLII
jgi:hypothetical protein